MDWTTLFFAAVAAGAIGVAYGYRGQRDIERDQVNYLRKQINADPPPAQSRALAPVRTAP